MMASAYWSSDDEFEVEKILDVRQNKKTGEREFFIKWKGYSSFTNTWEPEKHLISCDELLEDFLKDRENFKPKRKVPASSVDLLSDSTDSDGQEEERSEDDDMTQSLSLQEENFLSIHDRFIWTKGMTKFQKMLDSVPGPLLRVANSVNHEPPPDNFVYITKFKYGKDVPLPDPAFLTGCDCKGDCGTMNCTCLLQTAPQSNNHGHSGHYTKEGRLKLTSGRQPFIYECNQSCACASRSKCLNRVIQKGRTVPLEIFQMGDARGWAVRAISLIPAGTFIDLYHGEIITDQEADDRFHNVYSGDERSLYLFDMDFSAEAGSKADFTVDAYNYGSVSRFFNHSCNPNLLVVPCFIDHIDQSMHFIAFFAAKDILPDQELCFDYTNEMYKTGTKSRSAMVYEKGHIRCLCGSSKCRRYVYPSCV